MRTEGDGLADIRIIIFDEYTSNNHCKDWDERRGGKRRGEERGGKGREGEGREGEGRGGEGRRGKERREEERRGEERGRGEGREGEGRRGEERRGEGKRGRGERGGLTGDGDVATTAISSERVSDGSECSSHGVREQGYLVWREGGRTAGGGVNGNGVSKVVEEGRDV